MGNNEEATRLKAAHTKKIPWKKWGPYLSERQWGTVREDLQRKRGCLELLLPRSGAFPGISLGGGWVSGRFR